MIYGITEKVKIIFWLNIAMFIIQCLSNAITYQLALYHYQSDNFQAYQLLTHMFTHGGLFHLLFNMLAFISFAPAIEAEYGDKKFLIYYLMSGLGAAALHMLMHKSEIPMVGASGAIYGMLVMFTFINPNEKIYFFGIIGMKAKWMLSILILTEVFLGFGSINDGIGHFAHLGGAIIGFIFGLYEKYK